MRTIYVAGASSEIERAEKWEAKLEEAGFRVISGWTKNIRAVAKDMKASLTEAANPMSASHEQRNAWAQANVINLSNADAFWLLLPETATIGGWIELGCALMLAYVGQSAVEQGLLATGKYVLCSGTERSIMTALADHFATDEEAFAFLTSKPETTDP